MATSWLGEELEPLGGERRERGHRALPQDRRLAEHPVEQRALELLERAGQTAERARGVDPHQRLGMEQQRLQHLQRPPDELGIGRRRHARARSPRGSARRARGRAARRAPGRATIASKVSRRSPQPASERRGPRARSRPPPRSGSRAARAPRRSPAARAAAPSPSSGAHASASSSGPSTTRSRATRRHALAQSFVGGRRAKSSASFVSRRHVVAAHQMRSTSPTGSAKSWPSHATSPGTSVREGSSVPKRFRAAARSSGSTTSIFRRAPMRPARRKRAWSAPLRAGLASPSAADKEKSVLIPRGEAWQALKERLSQDLPSMDTVAGVAVHCAGCGHSPQRRRAERATGAQHVVGEGVPRSA